MKFRVVMVGLVTGWCALSGVGAEPGDSMSGIGAAIEMADQAILIRTVLPDSPAELAGLEDGDLIVTIDGQPIGEESLDEAASRLRGDPHSTIELAVVRNGSAIPVIYRVMRGVFAVPAELR